MNRIATAANVSTTAIKIPSWFRHSRWTKGGRALLGNSSALFAGS